jgi:hypothetical protein
MVSGAFAKRLPSPIPIKLVKVRAKASLFRRLVAKVEMLGIVEYRLVPLLQDEFRRLYR